MGCTEDEFVVSSLTCKHCSVLCNNDDRYGNLDSCRNKCPAYYEKNYVQTERVQPVVTTTVDPGSSLSTEVHVPPDYLPASQICLITFVVIIVLVLCAIIMIICTRNRWLKSCRTKCVDVEANDHNPQEPTHTTDRTSSLPITGQRNSTVSASSSVKWSQAERVHQFTTADSQCVQAGISNRESPLSQGGTSPEEIPLVITSSSSMNPSHESIESENTSQRPHRSAEGEEITLYIPSSDRNPSGGRIESENTSSSPPPTPFGVSESDPHMARFASTFDYSGLPHASVADSHNGENNQNNDNDLIGYESSLNQQIDGGLNSRNSTDLELNDLNLNAANSRVVELDNPENYLYSSDETTDSDGDDSDTSDPSPSLHYSDYPSQTFPSIDPSRVTPSDLGVNCASGWDVSGTT